MMSATSLSSSLFTSTLILSASHAASADYNRGDSDTGAGSSEGTEKNTINESGSLNLTVIYYHAALAVVVAAIS